MSSSQGVESSASGRGKGKQSARKTKRHLSPKEEEILLASLKELIANGWKSDNDFRCGYLTKLEELMRKELPGTDLKGTPNLNSKLQSWKKNYNSLATMLKRSGIGFTDHMIDCTTDQWEEIVKVDPNAKGMRRKSWAMYNDWKEIFGKDRATGDNGEDVMDAVNDLFTKDNQCDDEIHSDYHVRVDHLDNNIEEDQSACGSENGVGQNNLCGTENGKAATNGTGKKRKERDASEAMADVLREMNRETNARFDKIAERIGYEYDLDRMKKEAFGLVDTIPDLTLSDNFNVCEVFAELPDRLLIFKGLPVATCPLYVQHLLKSKHA